MSDQDHTSRPALRVGGLVLAGGRSSRMGRPKAWLPVGGRTMLEAIVGAVADGLRAAAQGREGPLPLVVVGAPGQDLPPLAETVSRVDDDVEGEGPLRGMAAGLRALADGCEAAYISSCDVPLLRASFVARMIDLLGDAEIAVPLVDGRHHPLAAVYRLEVLETVNDLLAREMRRPFFLFERRATREVPAADLVAVDPELDSLRNFNTPEEYERLIPQARGSVVFEFYGVARLRAGREKIAVRGATLGAALADLERACSAIQGTIVEDGRLGRHYRLSLNGRRFVSDPGEPLADGDTLVVLSAEAGG